MPADPGRLSFESLEPRLVLTQVAIPQDLIGEPGGTVVVPVNVVDDATGVVAADISLAYDTALLDTSAAQISVGDLWISGSLQPLNLDEAAGTVSIVIFDFSGMPAGPGTLVNIEFDVLPSAPAGPTTIDLVEVLLDEVPTDPAPQPGPDENDGFITIPAVGRVDVTLVDPPTVIADAVRGEVAALPENLEWIDEWEEFSLEIWVSNPVSGTVGVQSSDLWLHYNANYFTATEVAFGPAFQTNTHFIDVPGGRVFVDASTALSQVGDDQPALLARVLLEPVAGTDNPGVPHDSDDHHVLPVYDLNLSVQDATITLTDASIGDPERGQMPVPEVWPVMFDPDDDGEVTLGDLSYLAAAFNKFVGDLSGLFTYRVDFDHTGFIDLGDLSWMATNYGLWKHDDFGPLYHPGFPEIWRPDNLKLGAAARERPIGAKSTPRELTEAELVPIVDAAVARLEAGDPAAAAGLGGVAFEIVDLPANVLGTTDGNTIQIDVSAAGQGWFVDATPFDDAEFVAVDISSELVSTSDDRASRRVDLLSVVFHELGHVLGYEHEDGGFMDDALPPGTRRLPMEGTVDTAFASFDELP